MTKPRQKVGVIGAGSFGTTVAMLLAANVDVLLYSRDPAVVHRINSDHYHLKYNLDPAISATDSLEDVCTRCGIIFPVLPSEHFRSVIKKASSYLHPYHILIHATKGFDIDQRAWRQGSEEVENVIHTMSQVITAETSVVRVGCLSGPNLHGEIMEGRPAAAVIASQFDEVIVTGHSVLNGVNFKIYGSAELIGTEVAGALKNTIAIGSGIAAGLGMGKNVEAFLVTRGLREMILLAKSMGAEINPYLGIAGIGDLIATATSRLSRNYAFGMQLARGATREDLAKNSDQLVEGVRTVQLMHQYAQEHNLELPIMEVLYGVLFQGLPLELAMSYLIEYPFAKDVDFL